MLRLIGIFAVSAALFAQIPSFDTLTAIDGVPRGINNLNQIVGYNGNGAFYRDAFGAVTPFSYPGAAQTQAYGINNGGQIAGAWQDNTGKWHGFVRQSNGTFTPFDIPNALQTWCYGINDLGQVSGTYINSAGRSAGFVGVTPGSITSIDIANTNVGVTGINNAGAVVGNSSQQSGGLFLLSQFFIRYPDGQITADTANAQSAYRYITASALNSSGLIAGTGGNNYPSDTYTYGFVAYLNGALYQTPTFVFGPGGYTSNHAYGVNDNGIIVGTVFPDQGYVTLPCSVSLPTTTGVASALGDNNMFQVIAAKNCLWKVTTTQPWLQPTGFKYQNGSGAVQYSVNSNVDSVTSRTGALVVGGQAAFTVTQMGTGCNAAFFSFVTNSGNSVAGGGVSKAQFTAPSSCNWTASADANWITILSGANGSGNSDIVYSVALNSGPQRTGHITVAGLQFTVNQNAGPNNGCSYSVSPASGLFEASGGSIPVNLVTGAGCPWALLLPLPSWLSTTSVTAGTGASTITFTAQPNLASGGRQSSLPFNQPASLTLYQRGTADSTGLRFVPIQPCRAVDTRKGQGPLLPGPANFALRSSGCGIPANAAAYALNITAVPSEPLGFLSIWPTGQPQPLASTLNSADGSVVANAALVGAGTNGSVSVYVTARTDVVIDINGYFVPVSDPTGLAYFPIAPCRLVDTRPGTGTTGPFGPPSMPSGGFTRTFPVLSGGCSIPAGARAYSTNVTVVPNGDLEFLTAWPAGAPQPFVSTLNSPQGRIVSNAAIVPAGANGGISIYTLMDAGASADVVVDINGYFAPPATGGLSFFPINPTRIADTRNDISFPTGGAMRVFTPNLPGIYLPQAFALNITAVPAGPLAYLTAWPSTGAQPFVSTLNSEDGRIVANAAIVQSGLVDNNPSFNVYTLMDAGARTDLVIDVNGYFGP